MQFLHARYEKGKIAVADFCEKKFRIMNFGCSDAHADLLAYQAKAPAKDPHLGQMHGAPMLAFGV